jgi:hypothetical protein
MINAELPLLIFNYKLTNEGLKGAREFLDDLESGRAGLQKTSIKEDWMKSQKAWLTYSFIDEISKDQGEQLKLIEGIVILLKETLAMNPQNLEA